MNTKYKWQQEFSYQEQEVLMKVKIIVRKLNNKNFIFIIH